MIIVYLSDGSSEELDSTDFEINENGDLQVFSVEVYSIGSPFYALLSTRKINVIGFAKGSWLKYKINPAKPLASV